MAEYLIQGETLEAIADVIRDLTEAPDEKYDPVNMPQGIGNVWEAGHTEGYGKGLNDGAEKLKQDEARTEEDIGSTVTETSVGITVASGYYAEETVVELDVQRGDLDPIVDAAYDRGYSDGYDEGLSEGGGGGIGDVHFAPLIEQANNTQSIIDLNDIDPWINDEFYTRYVYPTDIFGQNGYQFPDIVEYETSDPRSCPITVTFYNYNPKLVAHVVYYISDDIMQEYWYSVIDILPESSISESFDSESSRGSDWKLEIIGAYFTYEQ